MRFFISNDLNRNTLMRLILSLTLFFFLLLLVTNFLLYLEIGFTYESVVNYYLGSEENFRPPKSYIGLLQESHFHFFAMGIILVTLNHLVLFSNISRYLKVTLILSSFFSALGDIAGGWLIRYMSPQFAYLKIASVIVLQLSLLFLILIVGWFLYDKRIKGGRKD